MKHKLGIIVPYRNRFRQLVAFKKAIEKYFSDKDIEYVVIVIEQDNEAAFNRGKLLNVGALEAKKLDCDYVVFHDIDMLPLDVDYSYEDFPIHLASRFKSGDRNLGIHFNEYFGGVTLFPLRDFERVNGYSNEYWGWGFEDDDLFHRVKSSGLPIDSKKEVNYVSSTTSVNFNGNSSYVQLNNTIDYSKSFTIHASFKVGDLNLDVEKSADKYPIFSVPGYDFTLYYDSFKRYNLEIFDKRGRITNIVSDITNPKSTKATIVWDSVSKKLSFYLDKKLVGYERLVNPLYDYGKFRNMYLGCSNRNDDAYAESISYFKGSIDCFAVYSTALKQKEVQYLVDNNTIGLGANTEQYSSADNLIVYYDPKFVKSYKLVDISLNDNPGELIDCWFDSTDYNEYTQVAIPKRRKCVFKLLDHQPGGYLDGRWKDHLTRYNQLKFTNEVLGGYRNSKEDGLSNCDYKIISTYSDENFHQHTVSI